MRGFLLCGFGAGSTATAIVSLNVGAEGDSFTAGVSARAAALIGRCGVEVVYPDFRCCGMPQIAAGDGARAEANARFNIDKFFGLVESGCEIVTTCSTCSLALKHYYPEFWPSYAAAPLDGKLNLGAQFAIWIAYTRAIATPRPTDIPNG